MTSVSHTCHLAAMLHWPQPWIDCGVRTGRRYGVPAPCTVASVHWWEYLLQYFQNRKYCKYCFEHSQYLQYFHLQIPGICSENRVFAQHLLRNGRTACGLLSFPSFFTQGRSTGSPLALAPSPSSHTRMTKPHAQPRLPERAPHDDSRAAACTCATYLSEKASGHGGPAGEPRDARPHRPQTPDAWPTHGTRLRA